jgi:hypothetical protein
MALATTVGCDPRLVTRDKEREARSRPDRGDATCTTPSCSPVGSCYPLYLDCRSLGTVEHDHETEYSVAYQLAYPTKLTDDVLPSRHDDRSLASKWKTTSALRQRYRLRHRSLLEGDSAGGPPWDMVGRGRQLDERTTPPGEHLYRLRYYHAFSVSCQASANEGHQIPAAFYGPDVYA